MSRSLITSTGTRFLVIAVAGSLLLAACSAPGAGPNANNQRNATLANGSLTATVSATGNIQPEADVRLGFQAQGTVDQVAVKVGDRVKKGDMIAQLDTTDLELAVAQSQASLEQAKNNLNNADTAIEQARNQIIIATAGYSRTVAGVRPADVTASQSALDAAQANLDKLQNGPTTEDIAVAEAQLRNAEAALRQAQTAYDAVFRVNPAGIGAHPASVQLEQATNNLNSARANYDRAAKGADAAQLAAARQQVENARANLARTRAPSLSFDVESARAQIGQAELQLKNAQSQKANTETQIKLAELQVKQAERRLSQAKLTAPVDGVVSQVGVDVGESSVTTGVPAFTLVDDSKYHIDITVDEIDIAKIKLGQDVVVTLDSLPGTEVKGKVDRISPTSTTINGVVSYQVRVAVEQTQDAVLKPGMTANASIVLERRENVLLAPNWAVRRDRQSGKAFLTLRSGEQTSEVEVQLGLRNDASSEIVSGAKPGDVVVAPTTPNALGQ
jgi:HlyD family secretion protein